MGGGQRDEPTPFVVLKLALLVGVDEGLDAPRRGGGVVATVGVVGHRPHGRQRVLELGGAVERIVAELIGFLERVAQADELFEVGAAIIFVAHPHLLAGNPHLAEHLQHTPDVVVGEARASAVARRALVGRQLDVVEQAVEVVVVDLLVEGVDEFDDSAVVVELVVDFVAAGVGDPGLRRSGCS